MGLPAGSMQGSYATLAPNPWQPWGWGCLCGDWDVPPWEWQSLPLGWSLGSQAGDRAMLAHRQHILDPVLCCPPAGVPLFHPSRVRQLEEELRTMDQTLKSLIASEEEVLGQGCGAMCSRPPLSVAVSRTVRATSLLSAPLPPSPTSPCLPFRWA